jgi:hypothetical protein
LAIHIILVIMLLITVQISLEERRNQMGNWEEYESMQNLVLLGYAPGSLWATLCRFKTQLQFWWESFHWTMEFIFYVYPFNDVSFSKWCVMNRNQTHSNHGRQLSVTVEMFTN